MKPHKQICIENLKHNKRNLFTLREVSYPPSKNIQTAVSNDRSVRSPRSKPRWPGHGRLVFLPSDCGLVRQTSNGLLQNNHPWPSRLQTIRIVNQQLTFVQGNGKSNVWFCWMLWLYGLKALDALLPGFQTSADQNKIEEQVYRDEKKNRIWKCCTMSICVDILRKPNLVITLAHTVRANTFS